MCFTDASYGSIKREKVFLLLLLLLFFSKH